MPPVPPGKTQHACPASCAATQGEFHYTSELEFARHVQSHLAHEQSLALFHFAKASERRERKQRQAKVDTKRPLLIRGR
jgi:hypothetical protein